MRVSVSAKDTFRRTMDDDGASGQSTIAHLEEKIQEVSTRYEAEKSVVEKLVSEAEQRVLELARLQRTLANDEERHKHEISCEREIAKAQIAERDFEARRLESVTQRLRYQRDQVHKLESENDNFQSELCDITDQRNQLSRDHADVMHETQREIVELRTQLEATFKTSLDENIRSHYATAFAALPLRDKEALLTHARLKEEETLQGMGITAVSRRKKLEAAQLTAFRKSIAKLSQDQADGAFRSATTRHRRDAARQIAQRLAAQQDKLAADRKQVADDAFLLLRQHNSVDSDFLDEMKHTDHDKEAAIKRGLTHLERKVHDLQRQLDSANKASKLWGHRASTLRRIANDLLQGQGLDNVATILDVAADNLLKVGEESNVRSRYRSVSEDTDATTLTPPVDDDATTTMEDRAARAEIVFADVARAWEAQDDDLALGGGGGEAKSDPSIADFAAWVLSIAPTKTAAATTTQQQQTKQTLRRRRGQSLIVGDPHGSSSSPVGGTLSESLSAPTIGLERTERSSTASRVLRQSASISSLAPSILSPHQSGGGSKTSLSSLKKHQRKPITTTIATAKSSRLRPLRQLPQGMSPALAVAQQRALRALNANVPVH